MVTFKKAVHSSRSQMFFKIGVLTNFANFTGKHPCLNLFLIKLQSSGLQTQINSDKVDKKSYSRPVFLSCIRKSTHLDTSGLVSILYTFSNFNRKKPTSQFCYEGYFNNINFIWKSITT